MIEASLSKPHTSATALQDVYVCQLLAVIYHKFSYGICKLIDAYCLLEAYELPLFTVLISFWLV